MKWTLSVHPEVKDDIKEAVDYYASIDTDLAERFVDETQSSSDFVSQYPNAGQILHTKYRRVVLRDYPYMVCYRVIGNLVRVLAIVHCSRDPMWIRIKLAFRS